MRNLVDKRVVVTGAASGIGRALALLCARKGARLALADVDLQGLEETRRLLGEAGSKSRIYTVDVAHRERVQTFAEEVRRDLGEADVLINNAGVSSSGRVAELRYETLDWTLGVNFWGVVHGTKAFLPQLSSRPEASLVNISSVYGLLGVPGQAAYCASKFAVRGFTEALRHELHGTPVSVTLVYPGGVRTNIVRNSRSDFGLDREILEQGLREFELQLATSPERAAARIVDGVLAKRAHVLIGTDAWVIDRLARWFPGIYDWLVRRHLDRSPLWRNLTPCK